VDNNFMVETAREDFESPRRMDPVAQAQDRDLIETWLSGKASTTRMVYFRVAAELGAALHPRSLRNVTLQDLQGFIAIKSSRKPDTLRLRIAIVKSIFSFAQKTGYLPVNVAAFLSSPVSQSDLSKRYISEEDVMRMIAHTRKPRDLTILKVLYSGGLRVKELCGISWEDVCERENERGQISIKGKGSKIRVVVISAGAFQDMVALRGAARAYEPVFRSREGTRLSDRMVREIVRQAAFRAGIALHVSPHWLRHAHASHALDRGAPIHLVQATLGHASVATTGRYLHARPQESSGRFLGV